MSREELFQPTNRNDPSNYRELLNSKGPSKVYSFWKKKRIESDSDFSKAWRVNGGKYHSICEEAQQQQLKNCRRNNITYSAVGMQFRDR